MNTLFEAIRHSLHNASRNTGDRDYIRVSGETYWIYQLHLTVAGYVFWTALAIGSAAFVPEFRSMFSTVAAVLLIAGAFNLRHLGKRLQEQRQFDAQFYG